MDGVGWPELGVEGKGGVSCCRYSTIRLYILHGKLHEVRV